jgi:hypothetical protein
LFRLYRERLSPNRHAALSFCSSMIFFGKLAPFSGSLSRFRLVDPRFRAFSSEVDTGSREENASNKNLEPRSDSIGTGL